MNLKNKRIILFFLCFSVVVGVAVWMLNSQLSYHYVESQNGIWDLRGSELDKTGIRLSGEVEYVPDALLTPGEFAASNKIILGDVPHDGTGNITSRVRLLVPEGKFLEIAGFADYMSSRIYINGEHFTDIGRPALLKKETLSAEGFLSFTVYPKDGVIEIIQQSGNFVFRYNTSHIGWTVGTPKLINRYTTGQTFSYNLSIGLYLALFLTHLLLFMIRPAYRANLCYALLCLVWVLRNGITGTKPLLTVFPQISWEMTFRAEYLSVIAALILIVSAYNLLFPKTLPKVLRIGTYALMGAFALLYLFADTLFMSYTMLYFEIVAACTAVWVLIFSLIRVRRTDFKQKIIIVSLFLVLISVVIDSLYANKISLPFIHNVTMQTMLMVFSLFQMTAMLIGTMEEVAAAKEGEQRLALENDALDRVNRMKNDMMATISHEMRTPLAVMSGYSELISKELRQKGVDEQTSSDLDRISAEAHRLSGIMEEMQNLSRSRENASHKTSLTLYAVITQVVRMYLHIFERKNTRLIMDIEKNLTVLGNADELTQVMFNLMSNAAKHTENGEITVCAKRDSDKISVTISDTGEGIAPELLPRVFDQYVHSGNDGSGLGLYIVKQIIESHGGEISIGSEPGKGTRVFISLPALEEKTHEQ